MDIDSDDLWLIYVAERDGNVSSDDSDLDLDEASTTTTSTGRRSRLVVRLAHATKKGVCPQCSHSG